MCFIMTWCVLWVCFHDSCTSQTAKVIHSWRSEKREKGLLTVELKRSESREEKTLNMEISALIGIGLYQLQFANNDELDITRRKMVAWVKPGYTIICIIILCCFSVRRNALKTRDQFQYSMEPEVSFTTLPPQIREMVSRYCYYDNCF